MLAKRMEFLKKMVLNWSQDVDEQILSNFVLLIKQIYNFFEMVA